MEDTISEWFRTLRDMIINSYSKIEKEHGSKNLNSYKIDQNDVQFQIKKWSHANKGGGEYAILRGNLFEKIGVNISKIESVFSQNIGKKIKHANSGEKFLATGISLVAHMNSPFIPAIHFNTRYIRTESKKWFGGGIDLNPIYPNQEETEYFHQELKNLCNLYDKNYYNNFKKECDEYFFIKHRNESRGVGGIFFDYLNPDTQNSFQFIQNLGVLMLSIYPNIIKKKVDIKWTAKEREFQLLKRGKYAEFNLLYDRGTRFGLETEGNIEAIFMSLPPSVKWH